MSKHNQDSHSGMDVSMANEDTAEAGKGMKVAMSGNHPDAFTRKGERGHGEQTKENA